MEAAAFVEEAVAREAAIGGKVGLNAQLGPTDPTQYRHLVATVSGPLACRVVSRFLVAEVAWIVVATAEELDGDDVDRRVVVNTSGLVIDRGAEDGRGDVGHGRIVAQGGMCGGAPDWVGSWRGRLPWVHCSAVAIHRRRHVICEPHF